MYVIGVDVGTTGAKRPCLWTRKAGFAAGGIRGYGTVAGRGGAVEQRAEVWWEAAALAVRQSGCGIDERDIKALSLSTQGASSVMVDGEYNTLWQCHYLDGHERGKRDGRTQSQEGGGYYYRTTGWEISPNLDACKLAWLKANRPKEMGGK